MTTAAGSIQAEPLLRTSETLDHLAGDWRIWQLRRGHRFTTDDVLVAWCAVRAKPDTRNVLDLGAGLGSVGLMCLWRLGPSAHLVMVEAQEESHRLAARTTAHNGLSSRVDARHADLRDPVAVPERAAFDLVTGSPPYIPPGKGLASPVPQRAAARLELRGDVFDYARTAARALARDGRFCFAHAAGDPRPERAVADAGLVLLERLDVQFREGRAPTIAIFTGGFDGARCDPEPIAVRDREGRFSERYQAVRAEMGTVTTGT